MTVKILIGDVRERLAELPDDHFDCVVTSPPYWGLRDYDVEGQLGLEPTLGEHLDVMVEVFREVRRVLKPTGTVWLNYGDCYATAPNGRSAAETKATGNDDRAFRDKPFSTVGPIYSHEHAPPAGGRRGGGNNPSGPVYDPTGGAPGGGKRGKNRGAGGENVPVGRIVAGGILKPKDLCLVPNRLAERLQEPFYTGWIKREADRVWLAAMIDGEGSIFIGRQGEGKPTGRDLKSKRAFDGFEIGLTLTNTNRALVEECVAITGYGSVAERTKEGQRPFFVWRIGNAKAREVLREVYPHLVAKQHEARLAIACPPSGEVAEKCYVNLKRLHQGEATDHDMPAPASLFEQGWWVRSEIVWGKLNPMPESISDRPATAHEKIFMLVKSGATTGYRSRDTGEWNLAPDLTERLSDPTEDDPDRTVNRWRACDYYYDAESVRSAAAATSIVRWQGDIDGQTGSTRGHGGTKTVKAVGGPRVKGWATNEGERHVSARELNTPQGKAEQTAASASKAGGSSGRRMDGFNERWKNREVDPRHEGHINHTGIEDTPRGSRNLRNYEPAPLEVWPIASEPFKDAHFATFPTELARRCILAGCPDGGLVLDPFGGAGTVGLVADRLFRNAILIELNDDYAELAKKRITKEAGVFANVALDRLEATVE